MATAFVAVATIRDARTASVQAEAPMLPVTRPGTSRAELARTVTTMTSRLAAKKDDAAAVLLLAEALIRLQRVNNDGRAVITAEQHLREFLAAQQGHYEARRMLAAVLLSQHRFADAIREAEQTRADDPRDPWNYGVIGDGYMELGEYDRAFAAFDQMGRLAPGPSVYSRTSYALEIKGDLDGALEYMRMAAEGTSPNDPESQAWHYVQVGDLLLQQGRIVGARLEYERAIATFPEHPLAVSGLARIKMIDGDLAAARLMLQKQLARAPTPDVAMVIGDLSERLGDATGAAPYYRMAEQIERAAWSNGARQPQVLARFFIDSSRNVEEAVSLAKEAARQRRDIFTMDVLAAAFLRADRLEDSRGASEQALRTGSRDARILWHAAEIRAVSGDRAGAHQLLGRIPSADGISDLHVRDGVRALRARLTS